MKNNDMRITVDAAERFQTVSGFGTSACWWAQNISDCETRSQIARLLFSRDGLGLNIFRYNVGGGVNPEHNRVKTPWRNTESFYFFNEKTQKWEYDFTRDANAQAFLFEALSYGCVDNVVLFANSPHYSMTITGEASGSAEGNYTTNLSREHYRDFVDYFLTVTEYFLGRGVPVKYISPINEPQWKWGGEVRQEGCHFEPDEALELIELFAKGIEERGLPVKLSAPESGEISELTKEYFVRMYENETIKRSLGSFAYHCYWSDDNAEAKKELGDWYALSEFSHIPLEMTEWCELPCRHGQTVPEASAIMARVMTNDFNFSGVNSWTSWVAVNITYIGEDGLDYADGMISTSEDFSVWNKGRRYYAMAHFSRFVPSGSVMIASHADSIPFIKDEEGRVRYKTNFCAFLTLENKTVLVISNEDEEKAIELNCGGNQAEIFITDETHLLEKVFSGEKPEKITLSKNSVATVVIS